MGELYIDKDQVARMSLHIANWRDKMKKEGKRTTEATRQIFEIPPYDWTNDPKGYCKNLPPNHELPPDRCTHCGFKYIGWKKYPFCNICTIAMYGDSVIEPQLRAFINTRLRIPEGMTEAEYVIREKKAEAEEEYRKKDRKVVQSDFKVASDLV